jgi:hypothetical protein
MPGPYSYGARSESIIATCHPKIQKLVREGIKYMDLQPQPGGGHRSPESQHELFIMGRTTIDGISKKGKHNYRPSRAIDIAPYPVRWPGEDGISDEEKLHRIKRFFAMGGMLFGIAAAMGTRVRWGGDWDGDWVFNDQEFHDWPHIELIGELP